MDDDEQLSSYEWPSTTESLLDMSDDERVGIACLNFTVHRWHGYGEGYQRAARRLVFHVLETDLDQDYLVYPIVFCYRHALEVRLKELIVIFSQLVNNELIDSVPGHDLSALWNRLRPLVIQIWPLGSVNSPVDGVAAMEKWIGELSDLDEGSFSFRYPYTLCSKKEPVRVSIDEDIKHLDLHSLARRMERLLNILGAWDMGGSSILDVRAEAAAMEHDDYP